MREEILRMNQVTYVSQGVVRLDNFSLTVRAGEILGLVPINNDGLEALFSLLKQNLPLRSGYVYYHGKRVNDWREPRGGSNRISVIRNESCLAKDLTVADNIFVLRPGFRKWLIQPHVLEKQLTPFIEETGVPIRADAYIDELTTFQRFVVELLKAVVTGSRLIVLENADAFISDSELAKLQGILTHYAGKGIAFLYLSAHFEETLRFCHRTALMPNGHLLKYFDLKDTQNSTLALPCVEDYDRWVRAQLELPDKRRTAKAALELRAVCRRNLRDIDLRVNGGECVVVQDMDDCAQRDFLALLERREPEKGRLLVGGAP